MKKITPLKSLSLLITLFCAVSFGFGQIITFEFSGNNGDESSVSSNYNDAYLGVSTITRGSGLTAAIQNDRFNAVNWNTTSIDNAVINNDYMEFVINPNSGYQFDITTIIFNIQRSPSGLSGIALRNSIDGYSTNIDGIKAIVDNDETTEVITVTVNQTNSATAVTYRIYGYAEAGAGNGGFEGASDDIIVNGSVSALPACATTTTWTSGAWDNGVPTIGVNAIIADNYNTATNNSFSACSLIVNAGFTLSINDEDNGAASNTYIEVQNDVTVDGEIIMNPKAAFIQINDSGLVNGDVLTTPSKIKIEKDTPPMNNWYEYTYWSSPVFQPQIGNALNFTDVSRRYLFIAQNFLDNCAETSNNNVLVCGFQDDIDDNGDDWQWVDGTTVMEPGIGYATTHDEAGWPPFPGTYTFTYLFEGPFNNGVKNVPIYRNDSELNDINWNLIGNPYPSAIDADLFLAANSNIDPSVTTPYTIDGAIFLWSQNTPYSSTANGNQANNFSDADYAIINGIGSTAGGDGVIPNRNIPSGQAFFVSMSNSAPATVVSGSVLKADVDVVFNNSMRVKGAMDNSQFFKNSNSKKKSSNSLNKLWVNLTSDNGVFNQTLIGYVNGATDNFDGMYFDAAKNLSSSTVASLYTTIENSNKKFAIQGKALNSLNVDEIITLGFHTSIDVATIYTLSIAQIEGDFLSNNPIYIKDNLLNELHDLSASDYTFTSEVGEFNDRFEIVFNSAALSTTDVALNSKSLRIIELEDDRVQFTASDNLKIKSVNIFDLLGRQLYSFKGNNASETYTLSNLSSSIYIAKVELSNGAVVTIKAIKK